MTTELAKVYDPKSVEKEVYGRWAASGAFDAEVGDVGPKYCIVIPPPNVTAVLHVGHALNNTLQDILIRTRRMQGYSALWMPGTDHAGIATQTAVDKRLQAEGQPAIAQYRQMEADGQEGRRQFVAKVQAWKDEYEGRILGQLKTMGCSCDWRRTRFTMDEACAKAVREAFFKLFSDGLIYRGKRLVNWDPATQTVLADDEVEHEQVQGHFYYLRYPLTEPVVLPRSTAVPAVCTTGVERGAGILPAGIEGGTPSPRGAGILPARPEGVSPSADDLRMRKGRCLPHWTKAGATYAVTFRLADSLPGHVVQGWKQEREDIILRVRQQGRSLTKVEERELDHLYSTRVESFLDAGQGACHMKRPEIASMVQDALRHFDAQRYDLLAWCVMPNHVHVIVRPYEGQDLSDIMHSWKSFTAKQANRILGTTGVFWQDEYYDHVIRDEEDFNHHLGYLLDNPEKAGLTSWTWIGFKQEQDRGQDAPETRGRDAHATRGQDALATHGQDALATARATTYITVPTTRPETMLGDTAIAINPRDPRAKDLVGRKVRLPIVGREIPIIADEHVVMPDPDGQDPKARVSTGFLKVTPAHDPDDYAIRQRHPEIDIINILAPDGTISCKHGWTDWERVSKNADGSPNNDLLNFIGMDRFEARQGIVEWFRTENLLEKVIDVTHQVGHSYRSHVPIEPYLSDQWYVEVKKPIADCGLRIADFQKVVAGWRQRGLVEDKDGKILAKDTNVPVNSLAGLALMPLMDGRLKFTPERYANNYRNWLENLRDWPISRQLWWGHQIPMWTKRVDDPLKSTKQFIGFMARNTQNKNVAFDAYGIETQRPLGIRAVIDGEQFNEPYFLFACLLADDSNLIAELEANGFIRDPDVLDTWFSSALWPFSTLGWPGQTPELDKWYPGDVLCTAREIITLWVTRMVMMGQYCMGDIPFSDVFIHAMVQDGEGRKMSKSLGNGIDPLDIIDSHGADAMRFTLASMTTQTQDVRMPVEAMRLPDGREMNTSPKFDIGRNFANKLWNASRFAMMNLSAMPAWSEAHGRLELADKWILSCLARTVRDATAAIERFSFNELADTLYHFVWDDFCDWYLEIAKSRINAGAAASKAVLAHCLDGILRLLHPIMPFVTEEIWRHLNSVAPYRGPANQQAEDMLVKAAWPRADAAAIDPDAEKEFELMREIVRGIRNARTQHSVPPGKKVAAVVEAAGQAAAVVSANAELLKSQGGLSEFKLVASGGAQAAGANAAAVMAGGVGVYVMDIIDRGAELTRLTRQAETLRKGVKGIEGKLGNANFLAKAPPDLVAKERARLAGLQADLAAMEKSLEALNNRH